MQDYEVVITTYNNLINNVHQVDTLIKDIQASCIRHLPSRIILADDCSNDNITPYKAAFWNTRDLPVVCYKTNGHRGPFYAEQLGLSNVTTPYAIVLHADVRLRGDFVNPYEDTPTKEVPWRIRVYDDPLSVLIHYLHHTEGAVAVSCPSLTAKKNIRPLITYGMRSIGTEGVPFTFRRRSDFRGMLKMAICYKWQECYSFDNTIYALRMEYYNAMRFDELFAPYLFYFDDFLARCRGHGYRSYFTQETVVYHNYKKVKPNGSLAVITPDLFERHTKSFRDRYDEGNLWLPESLHYVYEDKMIIDTEEEV